MDNGDGELLPPHAFLPSAERSGMVREIDMWVTRQAIRLIDEQRRAGRELRLEVNLSGRTLGDPSLPRAIQTEPQKVPIDPGNLIFEVTETTAVLNMDEAGEFASQLTNMGCRFALDDFGAGFGSFYYLKYLPLEFLKIDGDFIGDLASNAGPNRGIVGPPRVDLFGYRPNNSTLELLAAPSQEPLTVSIQSQGWPQSWSGRLAGKYEILVSAAS